MLCRCIGITWRRREVVHVITKKRERKKGE
jgi:hypothetical protein